jgi:hypothetical protein
MNGKPTYQQLCGIVGVGLMDMWKKGTDLTANEMSVLWNGYPLPKSTIIRALQEYNNLFDTTYTLDQVDIPTLIY